MEPVYPQRQRIKRQDVIGRVVLRLSGTVSGWGKTPPGIDPNGGEKAKAGRDNISYYEREPRPLQKLARTSRLRPLG